VHQVFLDTQVPLDKQEHQVLMAKMDKVELQGQQGQLENRAQLVPQGPMEKLDLRVPMVKKVCKV
jgi:GTP-binding protein EngB required for normal cell division